MLLGFKTLTDKDVEYVP